MFWADQNEQQISRKENGGFIDSGLGVWSDEQVRILGDYVQ